MRGVPIFKASLIGPPMRIYRWEQNEVPTRIRVARTSVVFSVTRTIVRVIIVVFSATWVIDILIAVNSAGPSARDVRRAMRVENERSRIGGYAKPTRNIYDVSL